MENDAPLALGIVHDGGGWLAALHDVHGERLAHAREAEMLDALAVAHAAGERALVVAAAVEDRSEADEVLAAMAQPRRMWVCRPWEAELAGALGGRAGVVIHSGMRAAANAVGPQGNALRVHQSEELLGEEGSALWLSTRALRMAVQGSVGRMQRSERLEKTLIRYFGADTLEELVERFEGGLILPDEMAGFVSVLLHLAEYPEPEPACRALLLQTARRLAQLVRTAVDQVPLEGPIVGSWSGFAMIATLLDVFRRSVIEYVDEITFKAPQGDPGHGAALLARAALVQEARREQPPAGGFKLGDIGHSTWSTLIAREP